MARVLFVSYDFPPSAMPGAASCAEIVRYLSLYGWEPTVLTANERHYDTVDARRQPPVPVLRTSMLPHPIEIYGRIRRRIRKGVQNSHSPRLSNRAETEGTPHGLTARILRGLIWLGAPDLYTGWIPATIITGARACRKLGIRCLVSSGPWWTNHLVGLILARLTRIPWVAHFRDPWSTGTMRGDKNLVHRLTARLERMV